MFIEVCSNYIIIQEICAITSITWTHIGNDKYLYYYNIILKNGQKLEVNSKDKDLLEQNRNNLVEKVKRFINYR